MEVSVKKLGIYVLVAALITVVPAAAQGGKTRTKAGEYHKLQVEEHPGPQFSGRISNTVEFKVKASERYVHIEIADDAADNVRATVRQDIDDDGEPDLEVDICNATPEPLEITPGIPLTVSVQEGLCEGNEASVPTQGSITAMFMKNASAHASH
jgi:hypothetical protein